MWAPWTWFFSTKSYTRKAEGLRPRQTGSRPSRHYLARDNTPLKNIKLRRVSTRKVTLTGINEWDSNKPATPEHTPDTIENMLPNAALAIPAACGNIPRVFQLLFLSPWSKPHSFRNSLTILEKIPQCCVNANEVIRMNLDNSLRPGQTVDGLAKSLQGRHSSERGSL